MRDIASITLLLPLSFLPMIEVICGSKLKLEIEINKGKAPGSWLFRVQLWTEPFSERSLNEVTEGWEMVPTKALGSFSVKP